MPNVDDYHLDNRDKNLFRAIKDMLYTPVTRQLNNIVTALKKHEIYVENVTYANSPKQITEKGHEILNNHKVESYINENCLLLKDKNLKSKTDPQIFLEALEWVQTKAQEKVAEIILNSNISQKQINELLALFILEKIKKQVLDK